MDHDVHRCSTNPEHWFSGIEAVRVRTDKYLNDSRIGGSVVIDSLDSRADQFTTRVLDTGTNRAGIRKNLRGEPVHVGHKCKQAYCVLRPAHQSPPFVERIRRTDPADRDTCINISYATTLLHLPNR